MEADRALNRFIINPSFRLQSTYLSVDWYVVDPATLQAEGPIARPGQSVLTLRGKVQVIAVNSGARVDIIYHPDTEFDTPTVQKWLRNMMREAITTRACEILPARVRYLENLKGLYGSGVKVRKLPKNILGCCTGRNEIHLPPFLVIFRQDWMDGVILHEMAHYVHKHHRKPFWDFLSQLLGTDARAADAKNDIALSPYFDYYRFLTS